MEFTTAKKADITRLENLFKKYLIGGLTWITFLFLVLLSIGRADNIPGRPDIRPLNNNDIVAIVRGFTKTHFGIDFACFIDTKICATGDGEIITSRYINGYGNCIIIKHNWVNNGHLYTVYSVYGHLQEFLVLKGINVKKGQIIALSGNTGKSDGPHLHYELRNANETPIWNGTYQSELKNEKKS